MKIIWPMKRAVCPMSQVKNPLPPDIITLARVPAVPPQYWGGLAPQYWGGLVPQYWGGLAPRYWGGLAPERMKQDPHILLMRLLCLLQLALPLQHPALLPLRRGWMGGQCNR